MGVVPISWLEIKSWCELTSLELQNWEVLLLKDLSINYTIELSQGSQPNRPSPYTVRVEPQDDLDAKLVAAFRSLKNLKK